ncbi:MAG: hypothetical protein ABMA13_22800 [Chthoniobacteraceae bacterium]
MKRAFSVALLMLAAWPARAEDIKPPFGLIWGETASRLESMLRNAKARIVEKRAVQGGLEAWDVDGLVQTGLKRTVFYFRTDALAEVELIYHSDGWDQRKYDDFMGAVRLQLKSRYGEGQQLVRKTEPVGDVVQTVVGYKWNQNNAAVELYYFAAQNGQNLFRTISVHYKVH